MQRRFQASVSRPKHDLDTSEMFSRWNFRFELVWVCRLVLTTEGAPWQNCCCVRQSTNLLFAYVCTVLFRYVAWLAFKTNAPQGKCSFDHRSNCWSAPIAPNVDDSWNQARCLIISVTDKELVESYQFRCSSLFFWSWWDWKKQVGWEFNDVQSLLWYCILWSIPSASLLIARKGCFLSLSTCPRSLVLLAVPSRLQNLGYQTLMLNMFDMELLARASSDVRKPNWVVNFVTIVNGSLWVNKASLCITSFHKLTMTDLLLLDQRLPVTWPYGQSYFAQGRINHVDSSKRSVFFLGSKVEGLASSKAALSRNASQVFNF